MVPRWMLALFLPSWMMVSEMMMMVKQRKPRILGVLYNSFFAIWNNLSLLYAISLDVYQVIITQNSKPMVKNKPVCFDRSPVTIISFPWRKSVKKRYAMARKSIPGKNTQNTWSMMARRWSSLFTVRNNWMVYPLKLRVCFNPIMCVSR